MTEQTPALLPEAEPTTVDLVKEYLRIDDDVDNTDLDPVVAAACEEVRGLPVARKALGLDAWPATITLGATALAAHLFPRRKKQDGSAAVNALEVADRLLERGPYARPSVG